MNTTVKLALYLILTIVACVFGYFAYSNYSKLMRNGAAKAEEVIPDVPALKREHVETASGYGEVVAFGAVFFIAIVGLGLLVGHDVSSFFGNRAVKVLYNDEGEGMDNPDYEVAEQAWANGDYLESIRLMREYLEKNPREQHVALRIAEIYEKDLRNQLAAALEYEEVLKQKLPADRWGWAAIHLCNLYFRMGQSEKADTLLRRIVSEYPETAAADKARQRLAQMDGTGNEPDQAANSSQASAPQPNPEPEQGGRELPPGFTLKKQ